MEILIFEAIAICFAIIIAGLVFNLLYKRKHSKDWQGVRSANRIMIDCIIAGSLMLVIFLYLIYSFGMA
jgi:hypothetical protein